MTESPSTDPGTPTRQENARETIAYLNGHGRKLRDLPDEVRRLLEQLDDAVLSNRCVQLNDKVRGKYNSMMRLIVEPDLSGPVVADDDLLEMFINVIGGVATVLDHCSAGERAEAKSAAEDAAKYADKIEQKIAELERLGGRR